MQHVVFDLDGVVDSPDRGQLAMICPIKHQQIVTFLLCERTLFHEVCNGCLHASEGLFFLALFLREVGQLRLKTMIIVVLLVAVENLDQRFRLILLVAFL